MLLLGISAGVLFMQRGNAETDGAEVTKEHYLAYQAMTKGERLTAYGLELKAKHDKYERQVLNHEGKKKLTPNDYDKLIRGFISSPVDGGDAVENKNAKVANVVQELEKLRRSGRVTAKTGDIITEHGPGGQNSGRIVVIEQDPNNSDILYAGASGGGIWKSTNMGDSWTIINGNLPSLPIQGIAISKSNSDKVFITLGDPVGISAFGAFVSENTDDASVVWTQLAGTITADNEFRDITQIAVHPNTTDSIIIAGTNGVWASADAGNTFTNVFASGGNVVWDIEVSPTDFNTFLATVDGFGIWKTTDFGANWDNVVSGAGRMEMDMSVSDPNVMYAQLEISSALGGLFRSNDMGDTWFQIAQSQATTFNIFSTDGFGAGGQGWYDQSMEIDPRDPNVVFLGGIDIFKGIMNNADSTIALTRLTDGYGEFGYPYAHVDQHGLTIVKKGNKIYSFFGNDGGVFMSPDGGKSFQSKNIGINSMQFYTVDKKPGENVYGGGLQDNGSWVSPANPTATDYWWAP